MKNSTKKRNKPIPGRKPGRPPLPRGNVPPPAERTPDIQHRLILQSAARARAKHHNLPFNLTIEDIIIPTHCPVLGIPLFRRTGSGSGPNSPSIDRIKPVLGYVKGNIIVVSILANQIKSNATPDQIYKVAQFYINLLQQSKNP